MPPQIRERSRTTPRAILLTAIESATAAGGPDARITDAWAHAALVARIARDLAPMADVDPTDAAGAGLLHDVGELLLLARHPVAHVAVTRRARTHAEQLAAEESAFGVDHALLGAEHLLELRMADVIAYAVADHHDPFPDSEPCTVVVAAADEIACADPCRRHALDLLGIVPETSAMIRRAVVRDGTEIVVPSGRDRGMAR